MGEGKGEGVHVMRRIYWIDSWDMMKEWKTEGEREREKEREKEKERERNRERE